MNDICGKTMHMGTMGRGFPVDVAGVISFSECLVYHGPSFAVLEAGEVNGKWSHTAQSQPICKVHNNILHFKIVTVNVICLNHEFYTV
jgi:hypothetical protein